MWTEELKSCLNVDLQGGQSPGPIAPPRKSLDPPTKEIKLLSLIIPVQDHCVVYISTMSIRTPLWHQLRSRISNVQRCSSSFRPLLSNRAVSLNRSFLQTRSHASISASELQFGQPLHETHPHLLEPCERMFRS